MWWAGLVQSGLGIVQTAMSAAAASKLPSRQKYSVSPEMRETMGLYREQARRGASQAETQAFDQRMARNTNSSNRTLQNIGMSALGPALSNIFNASAATKFAEMSSGIRRQGIAGMAGMASSIQNIGNMNVSASNQELDQKRRALGMGIQTGTKNIVGGVTGSMGAKFAQDQSSAYLDAMQSGNYGNTQGTPYEQSLIGDQDWYQSLYGNPNSFNQGGYTING